MLNATRMATMLAMLLLSVAVRAEKIDVPSATCAQLADWKPDDRFDIFVFYLGYYGGMSKTLSFDDDIIDTFAKKFEAWCGQNPQAKLLESVPKVFAAK